MVHKNYENVILLLDKFLRKEYNGNRLVIRPLTYWKNY